MIKCCCENSDIVACVQCGVKSERSTNITELIVNFLCSAIIDLGVEYGWKAEDTHHVNAWIQKALVSSGASALTMVIASTCLRIGNYKCITGLEPEKKQEKTPCLFYTATLLSEIISGLVSFGVGYGLDALIEYSLGHNELDTWKKSGTLALSLLATGGITLTKSLVRYGIFKGTNYLINKCMTTINNEEALLPLYNSNPSYGSV